MSGGQFVKGSHPLISWLIGIVVVCLFTVGLPSKAAADSLYEVSFSNVTINGGLFCPAPDGLCAETFSASFVYDSTNTTVDLSTLEINSAGALGLFNIMSNSTVISISPPNTLVTNFIWSNSGADFIELSVASPIGAFGGPGTYVSGIPFLQCETETCIQDRFANSPYAQTYTFQVSSVPEPSSLLLLGTGLVGLMGMGFLRKQLV